MRIKALREEKKLTQKQLSILSGVSQGKISEYESEKVVPRVDIALKLAKALETTVEAMMGESPIERAG